MKRAPFFLLLICLLCADVTKQSGERRKRPPTVSPVSKDSKKARGRESRVTVPTATAPTMEENPHKNSDSEEFSFEIPPFRVPNGCAYEEDPSCLNELDQQYHCLTGLSPVDSDGEPLNEDWRTSPVSECSDTEQDAQVQADLNLLRTLSVCDPVCDPVRDIVCDPACDIACEHADLFTMLKDIYNECLTEQHTFQHGQRVGLHVERRILAGRFEFNHTSPNVRAEIDMPQNVKDNYCRLVYGIFAGNLRIVHDCLNTGMINVDRMGYDTETGKYHHLLYMAAAARRFNPRVVEALIMYCPDINQIVEKGKTLLHYAVIFQNTALVALLLSRSADVNARDFHNLTPIMMAYFTGDLCIVRHLLATGKVDLFAKVGGRMACEFIFANETTNLFRRLLAAHDFINRQALSLATIFLTLESHSRFIQAAAAVVKAGRRDVAIDIVRFFVARGDTDAVRTLANLGAPFEPDGHSEDCAPYDTLMHLAVLSGNVEMVRLLCSFIVQIDSLDSENSTPLLVAIMNESADMVRSLVSAGARIHLMNALYYGVYNGHMGVIADTLSMISKRETAIPPFSFDILALAVERGHLSALQYLLCLRSHNILLRNDSLQLAFAKAIEKNDKEAISILQVFASVEHGTIN